MARTQVYYRLKKEYDSMEKEELKQDDKAIEKIIKLYMLEVLKYNLEYAYKNSRHYIEDRKEKYMLYVTEYIINDNKNFSHLDIINRLGYEKLNKKSYYKYICIYNKSYADYKRFLKSLDIEKIYNNKGVL